MSEHCCGKPQPSRLLWYTAGMHTQTLQTVLSYFLLTGFAFSFIICASFTPLFRRFVPFSLFLISLFAHTAVTNSWKVPSRSSGWDKSEGVVKFMHAQAQAHTHTRIHTRTHTFPMWTSHIDKVELKDFHEQTVAGFHTCTVMCERNYVAAVSQDTHKDDSPRLFRWSVKPAHETWRCNTTDRNRRILWWHVIVCFICCSSFVLPALSTCTPDLWVLERLLDVTWCFQATV